MAAAGAEAFEGARVSSPSLLLSSLPLSLLPLLLPLSLLPLLLPLLPLSEALEDPLPLLSLSLSLLSSRRRLSTRRAGARGAVVLGVLDTRVSTSISSSLAPSLSSSLSTRDSRLLAGLSSLPIPSRLWFFSLFFSLSCRMMMRRHRKQKKREQKRQEEKKTKKRPLLRGGCGTQNKKVQGWIEFLWI